MVSNFIFSIEYVQTLSILRIFCHFEYNEKSHNNIQNYEIPRRFALSERQTKGFEIQRGLYNSRSLPKNGLFSIWTNRNYFNRRFQFFF